MEHNLKSAVIIFAVLATLAGVGIVGNPRRSSQLEVSSVIVSEITQNSAKITWQTNRETQGKIIFGPEPSQLSQEAPESANALSHHVLLAGLSPGAPYYFKIIVSGKTFDQNGTPFSFITLAQVPEDQPFNQEFRKAYKNNDLRYDYDSDGKVTIKDWLTYLKRQKER